MKTVIYTLFFFLFSFSSIFAQWSQLPGPEGGRVNGLAKVGDEIWAGADAGLYKSFDNGSTWVSTNIVPLGDKVMDISVSSNEITMLVFSPTNSSGYDSYMQYSADAGLTWTKVELGAAPLTSELETRHQVYKSGNKVFYLVDVNYMEVVNNGNTTTIEDVAGFAADGDHLIMVNNHKIKLSTDNGDTWQTLKDVSYGPYESCNVFLEDSLIVVTTPDSTFQSLDLGASINAAPSNLWSDKSRRIIRLSDGCLYSTSLTQGIFRSCDNGLSWGNDGLDLVAKI